MSAAPADRPGSSSPTVTATKKLHVGNLSYAVNEDQLKAMFETAGHTVISVHMPRDRDSGSPRGFAFVEFASLEAARAAATDLSGKKLGGRPLQIGESRKATGVEAQRAAAKKRPPRKGPPRKGPPRRGQAKAPIVVKRGGPRGLP
jgi:RNA recognition motif-containing protein